ncbi:MAG: lipid-A-disaccharide synthase [SAR324 cluster bacterium]|uniref:Lipid-A-disaccharide synthase n=1 Tax=SAR324 cluster bacterium TaxID=2024889 RepID=A0A7X9FTZ6_9DELT|nr:lipid-A-disaccharide synthase [SAR324 cluster bacterium]
MESIEKKNMCARYSRIVLSAGEASGDEHGAELIEALKRFSPECAFAGMGSERMEAAGMKLSVDAKKQASVMGFHEVASSFGKLYKAFAVMQRLLREWKPEALIVIDFPDFNLRLARYAKELGIKVFYYITPKIWAWRSGRAKLFPKYIDRAACIFPFEKTFFEDRGYTRAVFVGHPFATRYSSLETTSEEEKKRLRLEFGLDPEKMLVCFFLGSRNQEIRRHEDLIEETWRLLKSKHPELQGILAAATSVNVEDLKARFNNLSDFFVVQGESISILRASDAGLIKSGTSNLQAAYCSLPFCMFYRISVLTAAIAYFLVKTRIFSIVNVIRPGTVKELIFTDANAQNAVEELEALLFNEEHRSAVLGAFEQIRQQLAGTEFRESSAEVLSAAERAALIFLRED